MTEFICDKSGQAEAGAESAVCPQNVHSRTTVKGGRGWAECKKSGEVIRLFGNIHIGERIILVDKCSSPCYILCSMETF